MHVAKKQDGVVLVEFALVLPILLLLVTGMMWFGFALNYWIDETHLTREAARYAAVNFNPGPEGSLQESIQVQSDTPALKDGIGGTVDGPAEVCITFPPNTGSGPEQGSVGQVGDPVQATMTVTFNFIPILADGIDLPGPLGFDGINIAQIPIRSTATMRLEAIPTNIAEGCA